MSINKTELLALDWLKKQGYKENEIIKNSNTSPDYICRDKKRFEVKFLYGIYLIFSSSQVKNLKDTDTILVFDRNRFVSKFLWKDKNKVSFRIKVCKPFAGTTIQINKSTREILKKLGKKSESYSDIILRLTKKRS